MMSIPEDFSFPFQPYEIQQRFMTALYKILVDKKIGIFESPTGTGKSLSLLCATLRFLKDHEHKIESDLVISVDNLNREILSCLDESDDWISDQHKVIQKKQELLKQQSKLDKIKGFNQKIIDIRNKIQEKERKFILKKNPVEVTDNLLNVKNYEETEDHDEYLILNVESDSDEEVEPSKENDLFEPLQVFFCSRTHSQLSQLVAAVKSTTYSKDLRSVTLASRQNYCINKSVRQLQNNSLINEQCLELQKSKSKATKKDEYKNATKIKKVSHSSCPFFKNNFEALRNLSLTNIMDIEELVESGTDEKSCPYYSSRAAMSDSQIIFVPYQILFSKSTRKQCGIRLKDSIVIIDEAHNLMDTISQIHTATVTLHQLKICHTQLMNYKLKYVKRFAAKNLLKFNQLIFITKQLIKFLEANSNPFKAYELYDVLSDASICNINFVEILKFCEDTRFAQKVYGYYKIHIQNEQDAAQKSKTSATKSLLLEIQEKSKKTSKIIEEISVNLSESSEENRTSVLRILIQFIECISQRYKGSRVIVSCDEATKETSMKFILLDPSNPFEELISDCRSIILAGGTMKPTEELTNQLFKNCKERVAIFSFGHVIPSRSVLPVTLSHGCTGKEFLFTHVNKSCKIMVSCKN